MQKIIRCSKLKISSGSKEMIYSSLLTLMPMIFFRSSIMNIIPYCIAMFIVLIFISDIFSLSKKVKIEMDVDKLLDAYKKTEYWSDKKYEGKYIKLKAIIWHIDFDEKNNTLRIKLKGNDTYKLEATAYDITPKCIEYVENMYEGKDITIYGNFDREENKFIIYMRYFK